MKFRTLFMLLLAMIFAVSCAMADKTDTIFTVDGEFDMKITLKAGDSYNYEATEATGAVRLTVSRPGCADVVVSIASAELDTLYSLGEMDEAQLSDIIAALQADNPGCGITRETTPSGNLYLFISHNDDAFAMQDIFTLYRGYYLELLQFHDDFSALTDSDTAFLMDVLYGINAIKI